MPHAYIVLPQGLPCVYMVYFSIFSVGSIATSSHMDDMDRILLSHFACVLDYKHAVYESLWLPGQAG